MHIDKVKTSAKLRCDIIITRVYIIIARVYIFITRTYIIGYYCHFKLKAVNKTKYLYLLIKLL